MDLPSWARVGANVVIVPVKRAPAPGEWMPRAKAGTIVIVTAVYVLADGIGLQVTGMPTQRPDGRAVAYALHCFRPLVDQQTDIATHFAHHLKQPEKV